MAQRYEPWKKQVEGGEITTQVAVEEGTDLVVVEYGVIAQLLEAAGWEHA